MARSNVQRARLAYELAHVRAGTFAVLVVVAITALSVALHRTTDATWLVAGILAITAGVMCWRGGALRRGAMAGMLAGLPTLLAPGLVSAIQGGVKCFACPTAPSLTCMATCFGVTALVGIAVGNHATRDASPRRFALVATVTAALAGTLGCGTVGYGGAVGIVVALVAGSVTGLLATPRTAAP